MTNPLGGIVLAIDASTYGGTVAVLRDGHVLTTREVAMRGEREERLMPAVVEALAEVDVSPRALGAVVCGGGPGSFTSLRIAASIAKGIAQAANVSLYSAPSLALMVTGGAWPDGRYLATLDAIRGESYAAEVVTADGAVERYAYLGIVPAERGPQLATDLGATLVAADSAGAAPHARGAARLSALLAAAGPVDLDAWEPDYGRKAEAQVKWEAAHGRPLPAGASTPG